MPFEFKRQQDYDLHIALEVEEPILKSMLAKGRERGIKTRGVSPRRPVIPVVIRSGDVGAPASGKGMFTERGLASALRTPTRKKFQNCQH